MLTCAWTVKLCFSEVLYQTAQQINKSRAVQLYGNKTSTSMLVIHWNLCRNTIPCILFYPTRPFYKSYLHISLVSYYSTSLPFFYDGLLKHPSLLLLYCLSVKLDYSSSSPLLASGVCLLQPGLLLSILPYHEQANTPIRNS